MKKYQQPSLQKVIVGKVFREIKPDEHLVGEIVSKMKLKRPDVEEVFSVWKLLASARLECSPARKWEHELCETMIDELPELRAAEKLVDLGGGDGRFIATLATVLGLDPQRHTVNVESVPKMWSEPYMYLPSVPLSFWDDTPNEESGKISAPFFGIADNSVSVVVARVSLHHMHVASRAVALTDALRILKPGGLFILKEHDFTGGKNVEMVINWEHHLYFLRSHLLAGQSPERSIIKKYLSDQYVANYMSILSLKEIMTDAGFCLYRTYDRFFRHIDSALNKNGNVTQLYWQVWKKPVAAKSNPYIRLSSDDEEDVAPSRLPLNLPSLGASLSPTISP